MIILSAEILFIMSYFTSLFVFLSSALSNVYRSACFKTGALKYGVKSLLFIACLFLGNVLYAQYNLRENNVWAIPEYNGVDFNGGPPVAISTNLNADNNSGSTIINGGFVEGNSSLCDTGGNLLFYCYADSIWNKNNEVMANGSGLMPAPTVQSSGFPYYQGNSATQGSLIVPVISNPNQYYVFSAEEFENWDGGFASTGGRVFYSVVDMTLNNGLGDVVSNEKGILLDSNLSEKMTAVAGDNCDIWLLLHGEQNDTIKAYEITSAGINATPVTSAVGNFYGILAYAQGVMKVSPNRRKLIACSAIAGDIAGIGAELYDFDPATGIVSNPIVLDSNTDYGASFSPDNTKLYVTGQDMNTFADLLTQYDISLSTATAIIGSRTEFGLPAVVIQSDLKTGPDGKIYGSLNDANASIDTLSCISAPNLAGVACNFELTAVPLNGKSGIAIGFPNDYWKPLRDTIQTSTDTTLSAGSLTLQIPSGYFGYLWNDGTTDSGKIVTDTGTYWVTYGNYCTYRTDTFVVRPPTGITYISRQAAATLVVYPSPAQAMVTVVLDGIGNVHGTLRIIDAIGRTVFTQPCNSRKQTINVGSMVPGLYTVIYADKVSPVFLQQPLIIAK